MEKSEYKFPKLRFFLILFLVLIGMALCVELSLLFYKVNFTQSMSPSFCSVSDLIDCDGVAKTSYAISMGIPNSLWGLILYFTILFLLFVDRIQAKFKNTIFDVFINPRSYIAFLGLLSFVLSMILACISIFKIHKICYLCFCTYFIDLFIALIANTKGFFINDIKITIRDFIKGAKEHFVLFIIVLIAFVSTLVYLNDSLIFSPRLKKERSLKEFFSAKNNKYAIKGNVLGNENSKITVRIYSDHNCPYCRVVNIMIHKLAKQKNVYVEPVSFPFDVSCNEYISRTLGGHDTSCLKARIALAAKKQGKMWGVTNALFDKLPKDYNETFEVLSSSNLGLDIEKLKQDTDSDEIKRELKEEILKAHLRGVEATPSIEIDDILYLGAMPYEDILDKVNTAIKRAGK